MRPPHSGAPAPPGGGRLLYVAYWGLLEPLGRSLVLPAVRDLARRGVRLTLITFEKPDDLQDEAGLATMRQELDVLGIEWRCLRYHRRPQLLAKVFDIAHGILVALRGGRPTLVHARTFVGGAIGLPASWWWRVPCVYHNEGFWPDQQVEGGVWPSGGTRHRLAKRIERLFYERASGLVLLSRRSVPLVAGLPKVSARRTPIVSVPSCIDLDSFRCRARDRAESEGWPSAEASPGGPGLRLVYVGSLGGRYLVEPLGAFLVAVRRLVPGTELRVLTHSDRAMIERQLAVSGAPREAVRIFRVPHEDVPRWLCSADAGLFFLRGGVGAESCSPTKVGEYWGCGLPVVSCAGIGDTEEMIRARRVGVLVRALDAESLAHAAQDLVRLLADGELKARCRRAAEESYGLAQGIEEQLRLYHLLLGTQAERMLGRGSS